MKERAARAAFVQENENSAIPNTETERAGNWETSCPFHEFENSRKFPGFQCVSDDSVIDKDGHASEM